MKYAVIATDLDGDAMKCRVADDPKQALIFAHDFQMAGFETILFTDGKRPLTSMQMESMPDASQP
jgi:hypothetical protein